MSDPKPLNPITAKHATKENIMPETSQEANNKPTTPSIDELERIHDEIKTNFSELNNNEKSSAEKSYNVGHKLTQLHTDNLYRHLSDDNGKQFKTWGTFCDKGCGFTRAYADKLMKSAAIQDELEKAGLTTIKQSVANLYAIHKARHDAPETDIGGVWKTATHDDPQAFPPRKDVQKAINPESHASKSGKRTKRVAPSDFKSLLEAIKGITLSDENKKQLREILDEPVSAKPVGELGGTADQNLLELNANESAKLSA